MSAENYTLKPCPKSSGSRAGLDPRLCIGITADQTNLTEGPVSPSSSLFLAGLMLTTLLVGVPGLAFAQNVQSDRAAAAARAGAIEHVKKMQRLFPDFNAEKQATPPVIPELEIDLDPSGAVATFQPSGPTITAENPFFQNL